MGARLFEFSWCDDFSAARNYSLERATGDWIFWMDADDVLPADSGHKLRQAIAEHPQRDAAFWVTVEEQTVDRRGQPRVMGHAHVKLFPRHPDIRFRYRIHEQNAPAIRSLGLPIRQTSAVVRHSHADRSAAGERARGQRNLRLALLDLAEHPLTPSSCSPRTTHSFCRTACLPRLTFSAQRRWFQRRSATQLNAYLYLGQALAPAAIGKQRSKCTARRWHCFDDAALLMRLGRVCERCGQDEEAAGCYQAILQRGRLRSSVVHVSGGRVQAALRLGAIYARRGQRQRAERLWCEFLKSHPDSAAVQQALARSYLDPCSIIVGPSQ
jgi:tetratricopeptide (TPR) repeat protein